MNIRRICSLLLIVGMLITVPASEICAMDTISTTWNNFGEASSEMLLEIACGKNEGEIFYYNGADGDYGAGPEAFYVENENSIYILDTVNKRINHYLNEVYAESWELTSTKSPQCFYFADNGTLYVCDTYNGKTTLWIYRNDGTEKSFELDGMEYVNVREISFASENILCVSDWYDIYYYEIGNEKVEYLRTQTLECVDMPGVSYSKYLGAGIGYHYEMQTTLVESGMFLGEINIVAIDSSGKIMSSARVPLEEFVYRPNKYVQIGSEGVVYFMIPAETGLEVRKVILGRTSDSQLDEVMALAEEYETQLSTAAEYSVASAFISLTRQEVLERANLIVTQTWTLSADNVDIENMSNVELPDYIQEIVDSGALDNGGTVSMEGIPYCWGGYDSRYTSNTSYDTFVEAIENGYVAGNVSTASSGKVGGTAGLDCSGFVSAAYGLSKKGTSYFSNNGTNVTTDTIGTMDYLIRYNYPNKGNHVVLFYNWQNTDKSRMLIIEVAIRSSTDDITVIMVRDSDYFLNNGYVMKTPW